MTARLIADLTEAIQRVQAALGIERTRRLLTNIAKGLGAPKREQPPKSE